MPLTCVSWPHVCVLAAVWRHVCVLAAGGPPHLDAKGRIKWKSSTDQGPPAKQVRAAHLRGLHTCARTHTQTQTHARARARLVNLVCMSIKRASSRGNQQPTGLCAGVPSPAQALRIRRTNAAMCLPAPFPQHACASRLAPPPKLVLYQTLCGPSPPLLWC